MTRDWKLFWAAQSDPHHPSSIPQFFLNHGRELALVVGDPTGKRVLEFGCGSGELYKTLGFDKAQTYRGVDFSEKMLSVFRAMHPGVDTVYGDGSTYRDAKNTTSSFPMPSFNISIGICFATTLQTRERCWHRKVRSFWVRCRGREQGPLSTCKRIPRQQSAG